MYACWEPAVLGMIRNLKTGTFHPVVFMVSPLPGGHDSQPVDWARYRSKMHHTTGFATREDAVASLAELSAQVKEHLTPGRGPRLLKAMGDPRKDIEWDGEGVPAMTPMIGNDELAELCPVCEGKPCAVRDLKDCPRCHGKIVATD